MDENIKMEPCVDEKNYQGLSCVIQAFLYDVKAGALPEPSAEFQTRTWNDYMIKFKWENQFELARSRWLVRAYRIEW